MHAINVEREALRTRELNVRVGPDEKAARMQEAWTLYGGRAFALTELMLGMLTLREGDTAQRVTKTLGQPSRATEMSGNKKVWGVPESARKKCAYLIAGASRHVPTWPVLVAYVYFDDHARLIDAQLVQFDPPGVRLRLLPEVKGPGRQ